MNRILIVEDDVELRQLFARVRAGLDNSSAHFSASSFGRSAVTPRPVFRK